MLKKWIKGLKKTKDSLMDKMEALITGYKKLDDSFYEELEELLITSDMGVMTSMELVEELKDEAKKEKIEEPQGVMNLLKEKIREVVSSGGKELKVSEGKLSIYIVIGVNGVGKTTSIGKLAYRLKNEGKKVMLAAGDTFRAGAIEQLKVWGERVDVPVIATQEGADPGAVVFDSIQAAKARGMDVLIIDTAGRLHNKSNLMEEMKKIGRIIERESGKPADEILLVLDGGTGQNALSQGEAFKESLNGLTGLIITKLDGSAKGGVIIPLINQLQIPVKLVGIGEGLEDLELFSAEEFVEGLFGEEA